MPTTLEKQLNIWTVQEKLSELDSERQLELKLKVLRDQYIDQIIFDYNLSIFNSSASIDLELCPNRMEVDQSSIPRTKGSKKVTFNHKKNKLNKCVIL